MIEYESRNLDHPHLHSYILTFTLILFSTFLFWAEVEITLNIHKPIEQQETLIVSGHTSIFAVVD